MTRCKKCKTDTFLIVLTNNGVRRSVCLDCAEFNTIEEIEEMK